MPTDARDKLRKATPSLPVRPVEISLIATYPNPWARRPRDEYKALVANRWSPHSATFRSVANVPNQILRKLSGRTTTPDLIQVVDVSSLDDLANAISRLPRGGERPAGSVKRVNLFAHGNPGLIGLRGRIAPKDHAVYFGDAGPDDRPEVLMAEVDLGASWAIDELAISWINSCARGLALRERIRRVFCQRAELWLIVCHGAGGLSGIDAGAGSNLSRARGIDAGAGSNLSRALASTFQVTVRSYAQSVWYWPTRDEKRGRITAQDTTSDGEAGERYRGYYCAENIVDPDTNEHVGAHMRKAASFEPDPEREPHKVTCP